MLNKRRGQNDDKSQALISDVKGKKLDLILVFILKVTKLCIEAVVAACYYSFNENAFTLQSIRVT